MLNPTDILAEAGETLGDRNIEYGGPADMHGKIAEFWNVYLGGEVVDPHDVAMMLTLMKVARITLGVAKHDNYVDLAGYASIAGSLAGIQEPGLPDYEDAEFDSKAEADKEILARILDFMK